MKNILLKNIFLLIILYSINLSAQSIPQFINISFSPDTVWREAGASFQVTVFDTVAHVQYAEAFYDNVGKDYSGIKILRSNSGNDSTHDHFYYDLDVSQLSIGAHKFLFHVIDSAGNWSNVLECCFNMLYEEKNNNWAFYGQNVFHNGYNKFDSIKVPLRLRWQKSLSNMNLGQFSIINDIILICENNQIAQSKLRSINLNDGSENYDIDFGGIYAVGLPTIAMGNLILQSNSETLGSYISSFDFITGNLKWKQALFPQWDQNWQPVYRKNIVIAFIGGSYNGLKAFDLKTGNQLWSKIETVPYYSCPALYDTVFYCYDEDTLKAFNIFNGKRLWARGGMPNYSYGNLIVNVPVLDTLAKLIFLSDTKTLLCYDITGMRTEWSLSGKFIAPPAVYNGRVFDIDSSTFKVYEEATGTLLYRFELNRNISHAPVISNGLVFISSDTHVYALDINTFDIRWDYITGGELVVANNLLIVSEKHGYLSVFEFDPTSGIKSNRIEKIIFNLEQNYPNPFNASTLIRFSIPERSFVTLSVFNPLGKQVRILNERILDAGKYEVPFNAVGLTSGIYFYTLRVNNTSLSKKLILLK